MSTDFCSRNTAVLFFAHDTKAGISKIIWRCHINMPHPADLYPTVPRPSAQRLPEYFPYQGPHHALKVVALNDPWPQRREKYAHHQRK